VSNRDKESVSADIDMNSGQNKLNSFYLNNETTGVIGDTRWKTKRVNLQNVKGHDIQLQIGSEQGMWRLRRMFIQARDMGKRG